MYSPAASGRRRRRRGPIARGPRACPQSVLRGQRASGLGSRPGVPPKNLQAALRAQPAASPRVRAAAAGAGEAKAMGKGSVRSRRRRSSRTSRALEVRHGGAPRDGADFPGEAGRLAYGVARPRSLAALGGRGTGTGWTTTAPKSTCSTSCG